MNLFHKKWSKKKHPYFDILITNILQSNIFFLTQQNNRVKNLFETVNFFNLSA